MRVLFVAFLVCIDFVGGSKSFIVKVLLLGRSFGYSHIEALECGVVTLTHRGVSSDLAFYAEPGTGSLRYGHFAAKSLAEMEAPSDHA